MANYPFILISELVTVEHGKYIVKVAIELQEKIITTAHAEGYTIEEAEDNARKRAIAFANEWVKVNNISPTTMAYLPTPHSPLPTSPQVESKPLDIKPPIPPQVESKPLDIKPPNPPQEDSKPLEVKPPIPPVNETVNETYDDFSLEIPPYQNGKEETLPLDIPSIEETPTLPLSLEVDETMDFSQIIDQTTIEMKRLGWTQDQGKKYLLETYGKKSRHLLSDQELIEFLQYLQSQA